MRNIFVYKFPELDEIGKLEVLAHWGLFHYEETDYTQKQRVRVNEGFANDKFSQLFSFFPHSSINNGRLSICDTFETNDLIALCRDEITEEEYEILERICVRMTVPQIKVHNYLRSWEERYPEHKDLCRKCRMIISRKLESIKRGCAVLYALHLIDEIGEEKAYAILEKEVESREFYSSGRLYVDS